MDKPTNLDTLPHILSVVDVSVAFGISQYTAYELMKSPGFPSFKVGRKWFVFRDSFIGWMSGNGNFTDRGNS